MEPLCCVGSQSLLCVSRLHFSASVSSCCSLLKFDVMLQSTHLWPTEKWLMNVNCINNYKVWGVTTMIKMEGHKEMWIEKWSDLINSKTIWFNKSWFDENRAMFYHLKNLFLQGERNQKQLTKIGNDWKCSQVNKESGNKTVFLKNFTSLQQIVVQWQFVVFV